MHTYVCLLRAINVGGNNLMKMTELKETLQKAGFSQVSTYLQSGNVVLNSHHPNIETAQKEIQDAIKNEFHLDIKAILFHEKEWISVVENLPFPDKDPKQIYITLLEKNIEEDSIKLLMPKLLPEDKVVYKNRALYLYFPGGYGNTKLTLTFVEKQLGLYATTRNKNTVEQIKRMLT